MSINTLLSRLLPPITVDVAVQPPPYSTFGPSAEHPHLDIHNSEGLCWGYTFVIVCAQLVAFGRVSERREEYKRKARLRRAYVQADITRIGNYRAKIQGIHMDELKGVGKEEIMTSEEECHSCAESDLDSPRAGTSDDSYVTTDSEATF